MGEGNKDEAGGGGVHEQKKAEIKESKENNNSNNNESANEVIVIKVDMHCQCEACAKKVLRALRSSEGVEDVVVDRKTNTVAVKGKTADPVKLCERISKKTGRKSQLLSPLPKPPEDLPKDTANNEDQKDQPPPVVTIVLGVAMHCEACAQLLRKRIRKMKGVESVETDVSKGEVIVKGVIPDPEILVKYVHKRTRKQASIVKGNEEGKKQNTTSSKQDKKENDKKEQQKKEKDNNEVVNNNMIIDQDANAKMMMMMGETNRSYDYYWPSERYDYMEHHHHHLHNNNHPQIFSDENPNACSMM